MNGPHWIKQWIADLALLNEQFRDENGTVDFDALGREEFQFRMALITRNFKKSERAKVVFEQAAAAYQVNVERGKKGGRPRKETIQGDADTSDGSDESTTVSKDMGRVAQNGTHPRIQGGDRAAQGSMSPSPSGAAQDGKFRGSAKTQGDSNTGSTVPAVRPESGNIYDQETLPTISTSEARESQRRAGADSVRGTPLHSAPSRTLPLPTWDEFTLFIDGDGLDYTDAREWWEMTMVDRAGHDRYGRPITNWKVACRRFCKAKANKRTPNGETT